MKVLHQQNNWALVLRDNDTYLIRHLTCGSYIRHAVRLGCVCAAIDAAIGKRKPIPVDNEILKMYLFITGAK
jgi:hypothetical protein